MDFINFIWTERIVFFFLISKIKCTIWWQVGRVWMLKINSRRLANLLMRIKLICEINFDINLISSVMLSRGWMSLCLYKLWIICMVFVHSNKLWGVDYIRNRVDIYQTQNPSSETKIRIILMLLNFSTIMDLDI